MGPLESFLPPSRSRVCTECQRSSVEWRWDNTNRVGLELAAFKDLDHALVLVLGAELVLQSGVAGSVEDTLSTVANTMLDGAEHVDSIKDSRVSYKDLPAVQNIGEGDAAVVSPLLQDLEVIDKDNKVLRLALVEDLGGSFVGARHFGCLVKK